MARLARVVIPGVPHFITQRGNRQQKVFFGDADYQHYIDLMAEGCRKAGVDVLAYCLMPDHVQLMIVPAGPDSLRAAVADVHRRYARMVNVREELTGHLWQDRFASFPTDEHYALAAARLIEMAPVRAGLVKQPGDYRWSSAKGHISGQDDALMRARPLLDLAGGAGRWGGVLGAETPENEIKALQLHETTGRPLGSRDFVAAMEKKTGRVLAPGKRGPKPRMQA